MTLENLRIHRIVLEPTGGYERLLLSHILEKKLPVSLVNAKKVRDCARAKGRLEKTDKIDAEILAQDGDIFSPPLAMLKGSEQCRLEALVMKAPSSC